MIKCGIVKQYQFDKSNYMWKFSVYAYFSLVCLIYVGVLQLDKRQDGERYGT